MSDPRKANLGLGAEQLVLNACDFYERHGLALLKKVPTPIHPKKGGGFFYAKKGISDFYGTLPGGIAAALEVKSTTLKAKFELHTIRQKPHQIDFMRRHINLNGLGAYLFITFRDNNHPKCGLMDFETLEKYLKAELPALSFEWLDKETLDCPFDPRILGFQFLSRLANMMSTEQRVLYDTALRAMKGDAA